MKVLKKVISALIICTMMFSFIPIAKWMGFDLNSAQAVESNKIVKDGITYYLTSQNGVEYLYLTLTGQDVSGDLVIPEEVNGYPVAVDYNTFVFAEGITSITIPSTVDDHSFLLYINDKQLKKIIVDENNPSYMSDEYGVLYNKDKTELLMFPAGCDVEKYTIPASVTKIDDEAFRMGTTVTSFTVDEGNANYSNDEYGVIYNKDKTELIRYPSGNTRKEYTVPDGVEIIGDSAFSHSKNLESVTLPASVSDIESAAFAHFTGLKRLEIPYNFSGYDLFHGCNYVSKITAGESSVIAEWGEESSAATAISISKDIKDLNWCEKLHEIIDGFGEITVEDGNETFAVVDGVLYDKNIETLYIFPSGTDRKTFVMPDSVIDVDEGYFMPFKNLTSITLGKSFNYSGSSNSLDECKEIYGDWYGYYAYYSVARAFSYSSVLEEINVSENNPYITSVDGVLYSKDKKALIAYPQAKELYDIVIDGNTVICKFAYIGDFDKITLSKDYCENLYKGMYEAMARQERDLSEENVRMEVSRLIASVLMTSTAKEYIVSEENEYLSSVDGVLYAFDESILVKYPTGNNETFYCIPESVSSIALGWQNDAFSTPFLSLKINLFGVDSLFMKEKLRVHFNSVNIPNIDSLTFAGATVTCTDDNTETVKNANDNREQMRMMLCGEPALYQIKRAEKYFRMGTISKGMYDITLNYSAPLSETYYIPIDICGGMHTYDLISENENVIAEYDTGCFGELDTKVSLKVEETDGEKAQEMANVIVQSFSGVFPKQIYNISPVDDSGNLVQPSNGKVTVKIRLSESNNKAEDFIVFHWLSDTNKLNHYKVPQLTIESIDGNDYLVFEVDHFSYFAVCVEEEIPAEKKVSSISVATLPSKTAYTYKMDSLDLSGLALTVAYSDGSTEAVTDTSAMKVTGFDNKKVGTQTITVEYEGATSKFDVTVSYAWWQWIIRILLLGFLWY